MILILIVFFATYIILCICDRSNALSFNEFGKLFLSAIITITVNVVFSITYYCINHDNIFNGRENITEDIKRYNYSDNSIITESGQNMHIYDTDSLVSTNDTTLSVSYSRNKIDSTYYMDYEFILFIDNKIDNKIFYIPKNEFEEIKKNIN